VTDDEPVRGFPWPPVVIVGAVTLVALTVVGIRALSNRDGDGPRVVTDSTFVSAASAVCAEELQPLRPPSSVEETIPPAQTADQVSRVADGIDELAERIRELPIASADQDLAVDAWLADWQTFTAAGRDYANEVRDGDVRSATRAARKGDPAQVRADKFARANGLAACQLRPPFTPN
jgi:hypothetical protein